MFGDKGVDIGGTGVVDSYDSAQGPYTAPPRGATPQVGAFVGTNGTAAGIISLGGSSYVDGDLIVGPGANPSTAVSGAQNASGVVEVAATPKPLPVVSPSPAPTGPYNALDCRSKGNYYISPGSYGALDVGSQAVVYLTATTGATPPYYYFNGDVNVGAGGQIVIQSGPVDIFFAQGWDTGGNAIVNATGTGGTMGTPANVRIYGTATAGTVKLDGGGQTALCFYAPTADVTFVGTADLYGSIVGSTVHMRGTAGIHYDGQCFNARFDSFVGPWTLTAFHRW